MVHPDHVKEVECGRSGEAAFQGDEPIEDSTPQEDRSEQSAKATSKRQKSNRSSTSHSLGHSAVDLSRNSLEESPGDQEEQRVAQEGKYIDPEPNMEDVRKGQASAEGSDRNLFWLQDDLAVPREDRDWVTRDGYEIQTW